MTYLVKKKDQSTFYRYDNLKVREGFTGIKIIKRGGAIFKVGRVVKSLFMILREGYIYLVIFRGSR